MIYVSCRPVTRSLGFLIGLVSIVILVASPMVFGQGYASDQAEILESWEKNLGNAGKGSLSFRFEVSFLKIDVADIEARLAAAEADILEGIVGEGKATKSRRNRAAGLMISADTAAFRFIFLRDGGIERFMKGTRGNLEAARKWLLQP